MKTYPYLLVQSHRPLILLMAIRRNELETMRSRIIADPLRHESSIRDKSIKEKVLYTPSSYRHAASKVYSSSTKRTV